MLLTEFSLLPVNLIQILSLFVGLFGSALLAGEKRYHGLVLALIVQSVFMAFNLYEELNAPDIFWLVTPALSLAIGPIFYLLSRSLLVPELPLRWRDAIHFLPVVLALPFTGHFIVVLLIGAASQIAYISLALRWLNRYHAAVKERFSDTTPTELRWLYRLLLVQIGLLLLDVLRVNLQTITPFELRNLWYLADQVAFLVVLCAIIIGLIRQPALFNGLQEVEQSSEETASKDSGEAQSIFMAIDAEVKA